MSNDAAPTPARRQHKGMTVKEATKVLILAHDTLVVWSRKYKQAEAANDYQAMGEARFMIARVQAEILMTRTHLHLAKMREDVP